MGHRPRRLVLLAARQDTQVSDQAALVHHHLRQIFTAISFGEKKEKIVLQEELQQAMLTLSSLPSGVRQRPRTGLQRAPRPHHRPRTRRIGRCQAPGYLVLWARGTAEEKAATKRGKGGAQMKKKKEKEEKEKE